MNGEKMKRWRKSVKCPKNENVDCQDPSRCEGCGWNPEVAKMRMDAFLGQFKEEKPT